MCLACATAESAYSKKQEQQIDYSSNQEYNNKTY